MPGVSRCQTFSHHLIMFCTQVTTFPARAQPPPKLPADSQDSELLQPGVLQPLQLHLQHKHPLRTCARSALRSSCRQLFNVESSLPQPPSHTLVCSAVLTRGTAHPAQPQPESAAATASTSSPVPPAAPASGDTAATHSDQHGSSSGSSSSTSGIPPAYFARGIPSMEEAIALLGFSSWQYKQLLVLVTSGQGTGDFDHESHLQLFSQLFWAAAAHGVEDLSLLYDGALAVQPSHIAAIPEGWELKDVLISADSIAGGEDCSACELSWQRLLHKSLKTLAVRTTGSCRPALRALYPFLHQAPQLQTLDVATNDGAQDLSFALSRVLSRKEHVQDKPGPGQKTGAPEHVQHV